MVRVIYAAGKSVIVDRAAPPLLCARIVHQFELDGAAGLLLDNDRTRANVVAAADKVAYLDLHKVASTQFAVDSQVKQRSIAKPPVVIEEDSNGPDLT